VTTQNLTFKPNKMVVSHKIKDYSTLIISNYSGGKQVGFLYLYDPSNKYNTPTEFLTYISTKLSWKHCLTP